MVKKSVLMMAVAIMFGQLALIPLFGQSTIPSTMFGIHQGGFEGCDSPPYNYAFTDVGAMTLRTWNSCMIYWANMNPSDGVYYFHKLDALLAAAKSAGMADVYLQLGNTPPWISQNPYDPNCDQENGYCQPPSDINPNGSGTDLAWRKFIQVLALHVTDPTYLQTHAAVRYWEIWNEIYRSDTLSNYSCDRFGKCAYRGTFAQILRMAQDMKCILKGIADDPITGSGKTCGTAGYGQIGLDKAAQTMAADAESFPAQASAVYENFLRCDQRPPAGSMCTWSRSNPLGSNTTDAIVLHVYTGAAIYPERFLYSIAQFREILSAADQKKPMFTGEGSWGPNSTQKDPDLTAGFVPRYFLSMWMSGMRRVYWYAWSSWEATGGLWSPTALDYGHGDYVKCQHFDSKTNGYWCTGATAYAQTVKWLSGANVVGWTCPPGGCGMSYKNYMGVYTFDISDDNGYHGEIAWDDRQTSPCRNPQCGTTPYVAPGYTTQWRDLNGVIHQGTPTKIGAEPILSENFSRHGQPVH
jgi:hypothetical protein